MAKPYFCPLVQFPKPETWNHPKPLSSLTALIQASHCHTLTIPKYPSIVVSTHHAHPPCPSFSSTCFLNHILLPPTNVSCFPSWWDILSMAAPSWPSTPALSTWKDGFDKSAHLITTWWHRLWTLTFPQQSKDKFTTVTSEPPVSQLCAHVTAHHTLSIGPEGMNGSLSSPWAPGPDPVPGAQQCYK